MERILVLDRGNTRMKLGLFEGDEFLLSKVLENADQLKDFVQEHKVSICCHADVHGDLSQWLGDTTSKAISFSEKLPITLDYKNAGSLGQDRIANAAGAKALYPEKDVLVIDAGSCVTYDFINAQGKFLGGAISPGWAMRLKAMHQFTGKLPLLSNEPAEGAFPYSGTENNMRGAAFDGLGFEITAYINEIRRQYPDSITLITGGDAAALHKALKIGIFADQNLTLKGIFNIYKHQYA